MGNKQLAFFKETANGELFCSSLNWNIPKQTLRAHYSSFAKEYVAVVRKEEMRKWVLEFAPSIIMKLYDG